MSWVKLDDQFFRNPKAIEAGPDGRALYLAGLCYCASQLSDGRIPVRAVRIVAVDAEVDAGLADTLVDVGLWRREGDSFVVNDYLDYNPSREKVLTEREKKAAAGKKGADARWNGKADAVDNSGQGKPAGHGTADGTSHSSRHGTSHSTSDGTSTPSATGSSMPPSRPVPVTSLTSSTGLQVGDPQPGDNEDRVAVAARRLGQLDHDQAEAAGKVRANPDGHLAACIRNRANDPQLNAIAGANPNWTADQLVAAVTGELTRLELAKAAEATQAELDELRAIPADPATNVAGLAEARQARTKPRTA